MPESTYASWLTQNRRSLTRSSNRFSLENTQNNLHTKTSSNPSSTEHQPPTHTVSLKRHEQLSFVHHRLWKIHSGYVRTLTCNAEGDLVPLGFWTKGDVVGYPVSHTSPYIAECLTAVEAEYLSENASTSHEIMLSQIYQSTSLLRIIHCKDSQQRILQFVCWLAERFGEPCDRDFQIHLRLTHQEIAESVGTTRVTVTRLLKSLEKSGQLIWKTNKKIIFRETFERCHVLALG